MGLDYKVLNNINIIHSKMSSLDSSDVNNLDIILTFIEDLKKYRIHLLNYDEQDKKELNLYIEQFNDTIEIIKHKYQIIKMKNGDKVDNNLINECVKLYI